MFVAINYITCSDDYRERFEELFGSRARAVDTMPGFLDFQLLKPAQGDSTYLIMTHWQSRENFEAWTGSPEFLEGHKRGFADMKRYKDEGREAPLKSSFKTYEILTR